MRHVRSSSLNTHLPQLSSIFESVYWWLLVFCLNEVVQLTTMSLAVVSCNDCFLGRWEVFFRPAKSCRALFLYFLSDDWWCLIWMSFFKLQPDIQLQATLCLFLDRWQVFTKKKFWQLSSSATFSWQLKRSSQNKVLTIVKQIWMLLNDDWSCSSWMSFYKLQPGL